MARKGGTNPESDAQRCQNVAGPDRYKNVVPIRDFGYDIAFAAHAEP